MKHGVYYLCLVQWNLVGHFLGPVYSRSYIFSRPAPAPQICLGPHFIYARDVTKVCVVDQTIGERKVFTGFTTHPALRGGV